MWGNGRYFRIAAGCRTLTVFARSLIQYTSPPCDEFTREAIRAKRAQISGLYAVANQQRSPGLHWRSFMPSNDNVFSQAAQSCGEVGSGFKFCATSSCVRVNEKSLSCADSMPARAKEGSRNCDPLKRRSPKSRILGSKSGSPRPKISSMSGRNAPTALPVIRKIQERQGSKLET